MAQWTAVVGAGHLAKLLVPRDGRDPAVPPGPANGAAGPRPAPARRVPAYRELAERVRLLLLEGRVPVAARLPAERELAVALGVSRTTVAAAYETLRAEGFVKSRRGAGSWTAMPDGRPVPAGGLEPLPPEAAASVIDLGCAALPAPEPWLTRAFEGALAALPRYAATHGDYPAGLPVLREAIAEHVTARGVPTMPEQIMVTTGAMGAVSAVARLFGGPGERIAVEAPSYANVLQLLRESGSRLVPVPMSPDGGWDLEAWRRALREAAPRFAYVIPDFHNPTGALVPDGLRRDLVDAARAAGVLLVSDETMAELNFRPQDGVPRPLAAFDHGGGTVLTVGSASKAVWGGMRVGWIRATPEVVRHMIAARAHLDMGTPVFEQLAVTWLLRGEGWGRALDLHRALVRGNRDALVDAVRRHAPDWSFTVPGGGLTMWVRTADLSGSRLADAGERFGVRVPSGTRFGVDGAFEGYLRLPFTVGGSVADEALARLAAAAEAVRSGTVGSGPLGPPALVA